MNSWVTQIPWKRIGMISLTVISTATSVVVNRLENERVIKNIGKAVANEIKKNL